MNKKTQKILAVITGVMIVVAALMVISDSTTLFTQVFAQTTTEPQNGDAGGFVPCGNTADNPCQIGHLFSTFVVIINYLIAMAGFFAVIAIVFAGFMMVYSQGQEQLKTAKGRLSGAIIGLVLIAAAFVLINALFTGTLSIGVCGGSGILSSPVDYINSEGNWGDGGKCGASKTIPSTTKTNTNTNTKTNTNANANANTNTTPKTKPNSTTVK